MKECEIRPKDVMDQYLQLSLQDGRAIQARSQAFVDVACPACRSSGREQLFTKNGFNIQHCVKCRSIYCSPRPSEEQLYQLYNDTPSSRYWAEVFFPTVAPARKEKLFRPKAQAIHDLLRTRNFIPENICDAGAGYGLLLEELRNRWPAARLFAIEPSRKLAEICRQKGFRLLEKTAEDSRGWEGRMDLVTCFEVIEHVFDPEIFVASLYKLIRPGGYCLVTGLCGDGFDIQVLGARSKSIFPPHHINFLSVAGFEALFERAGFSEVSIVTPGKLDVDIVNNALADGDVVLPLFLETLLRRGSDAQQELQAFLVKHKLSSHVWILARRAD